MKASTQSSRLTAARFVSSQGDDPVVYVAERGLPGDYERREIASSAVSREE